jgi:hypothetical protein
MLVGCNFVDHAYLLAPSILPLLDAFQTEVPNSVVQSRDCLFEMVADVHPA